MEFSTALFAERTRLSGVEIVVEVQVRVHAAVQHTLDENLGGQEGVEGNVPVNDARPVAGSEGVARFAALRGGRALLQTDAEFVKVAIGLDLAPGSEAVDPDLAEVGFGPGADEEAARQVEGSPASLRACCLIFSRLSGPETPLASPSVRARRRA